MRTCPYCEAVNWDDTPVCHACGRSLESSAGAERTQPVKPQRPQIYDTQSFHHTQPRPPVQEPAGWHASQPVSQPGHLPPDNSPTGSPPPPPPPPGGPPEPPAPRGSDKPWMALLLGLVVLLIAGCALAIFTISAVTAGGINRLRANVSTQVADIFASPTPGPAQTGPAPFFTPTPWPTLTPTPPVAPTDLPSPTPLPTETQPEPTRPPAVDSPLLSPQCAAVLDTLSRLSEEITTRPTAPLDPTWRSDITQAIEDARANCGSLDAASPVPGIVGSAERNLALALDEFDEATRIFGEGVSELNPAKILEAGQHIQKAAGYLNEAIAELRKIDGSP